MCPLLPKDKLFKKIFDFTSAGDWDCVVALELRSAFQMLVHILLSGHLGSCIPL